MAYVPTESTKYKGWYECPSYPGLFANTKGMVLVEYAKRFGYGSETTNGYLTTSVGGQNLYIHRIVCDAFWGPALAENYQANHIDGDKTNNNPKNLEWCTPLENALHAWSIGLIDNRKGAVVWDVIENVKLEFLSCKEAKNYMAAEKFKINNGSREGLGLYRGRFYFQLKEDNRPWPELESLRGNLIRVKELTNNLETLHVNATAAAKAMGVSEGSVSAYLRKGRQYLNGHLFKRYRDETPWFTGARLEKAMNKAGIGILIYDIEEDIITPFDSIYSAHGYRGAHYANIGRAIRERQQYVLGGFLVKKQNDPSLWMDKHKAEKILQMENCKIFSTHVETGDTRAFNSTKEASRELGIPNSTLRNRLSNPKTVYDGYRYYSDLSASA